MMKTKRIMTNINKGCLLIVNRQLILGTLFQCRCVQPKSTVSPTLQLLRNNYSSTPMVQTPTIRIAFRKKNYTETRYNLQNI